MGCCHDETTAKSQSVAPLQVHFASSKGYRTDAGRAGLAVIRSLPHPLSAQ
jgi:hypothetical protein